MKKNIADVEKKLQNIVVNLDSGFAKIDKKESDMEFEKSINDLLKLVNSYSKSKTGPDFFEKFANNSSEYQKIQLNTMENQDFYEKRIESRDAQRLIEAKESKYTKEIVNKYISKYNKSELSLAESELKLIDDLSHSFETFIMVGCGSLSYTMLDFASRHPTKKCIGIDVERLPIEDANNLRIKFKIENVYYERINGNSYDYSNGGNRSLIFVANLVKPKLQVLSRIASTAAEDSVVILRNPVAFGKLLYEHADTRGISKMSPLQEWEEHNMRHLQQISAFKIK